MTNRHPLLDAVSALAGVVGAEVVAAEDLIEGDIPLQWEGETVGGFRMPTMRNALERLIATTEHELGGTLVDLDRVGKQRAVRLLEERGAFQLRRSIEEVADRMGVSRITIYNYLNTVREVEEA